jgi:hypothetical protein
MDEHIGKPFYSGTKTVPLHRSRTVGAARSQSPTRINCHLRLRLRVIRLPPAQLIEGILPAEHSALPSLIRNCSLGRKMLGKHIVKRGVLFKVAEWSLFRAFL